MQISLQFDEFFWQKFQNSNFAQIWDFPLKLLIQNLLGHPVKLDWIIFDHLVKTHLHLSYQKLTEVFLMSLELFKSDKNHRTMVFKTDSKYFFWVRTPPPFNLSKGFGTHKFQRGEKKSSDFKPVHWTRKISKKKSCFSMPGIMRQKSQFCTKIEISQIM